MKTTLPASRRLAFLRTTFIATLTLAPNCAPDLWSQTTRGNTATAAVDQEDSIVELSPFVIDEDRERGDGYRAEHTLIGRSANRLIDIPTSVALINKELLEDVNAYDVQQALNVGVSGVTENQSINDDVNIRGFRTTFSLRNGVTKPSFKKAPMYDVGRVEVLKGPGALLLGNNSFLGGAVNLISRAPTDTPSGVIQLTVAEHSYYRLEASTSGPLARNDKVRINYRATVGGLTGDREKPNQDENQKFVGAGLAVHFGARSSLHFNAYHFIDDSFIYYEDFRDITSPDVARLNPFSTAGFALTRPNDPFWKSSDTFFDATFVSRISDQGNLRVYYSYSKLTDRRRLVGGGNPGVHADNVTVDRRDLPLDIDQSDHDIQVDYIHKLQFDLVDIEGTAGIDRTSGDNRQKTSVNTMTPLNVSNPNFSGDAAYFSDPHPGAGLPAITDRGSDNSGLSYYFQANLSFLDDRLSVVGGLRWFAPDGTRTDFNTGAVTDADDTKYRTHKYGLIYKINPSVSIYYTNAQNVFVQNGFTDRFLPNDGLGDPLRNQEGILDEIGVKLSHSFSERFSLYGSLVYFDMTMTNVRTFGPLPESPGNDGIIQSEQDSSKGWEVDLGGRLMFGEGHADFIVTLFDADAATAVDPTQAPNNFVPRKTSLLAKYTFTGGRFAGLMVGGSVVDQEPKFDRGLKIVYPVLIGAFARYQWNKNWDVQLNLDNIKDERYIVTTSATSRAMVQEGMQTRLSVGYRW